jgi:glucose-1-phosphate thymidylyltransferase
MQILSRGFAWLDTGTHEALTEATEFVKAVEKRTGLKIACLEEIALRYKWINQKQLQNQLGGMKGDYFRYVKKICR